MSSHLHLLTQFRMLLEMERLLNKYPEGYAELDKGEPPVAVSADHATSVGNSQRWIQAQDDDSHVSSVIVKEEGVVA